MSKVIPKGTIVLSRDYGLVEVMGVWRMGVDAVVEYTVKPEGQTYTVGVYAGTLRELTVWDKFKMWWSSAKSLKF